MGTKYIPTHPNMFMGIFKETHIYPLIKQKVQLYLRYIDDQFFIQTGSENELQQFISKINEVSPSFQFLISFQLLKNPNTFLGCNNKKTSIQKLLTTPCRTEMTDNLTFIKNQSTLKLLNDASPTGSTEIKKRSYHKGRFHREI